MNSVEFNDGTTLPVRCIMGGPKTIDGVVRDVLSIEVDPTTSTIEELTELFSNHLKTDELYYLEDKASASSNTRTFTRINEGIIVSVVESAYEHVDDDTFSTDFDEERGPAAIVLSSVPTKRLHIGTGYSKFISARKETRKLYHMPGELVQDEYEEVLIVTIAQMTYDEFYPDGK